MQADFFTNILLPVGLGVLMLGMGLGLIPADFQRITRYPKAVLIGLVNQIIILPIVGFIIVSLLPLRPEIAVGLMIVAICPGGPSSNVLTYLADRGTSWLNSLQHKLFGVFERKSSMQITPHC
jgi:BASS family bile acid:Na+ symporter